MTTEMRPEILWIGEDGNWLLAEGHVDLEVFTAAADAEYLETTGNYPDGVPSSEYEARHAYWRPATRAECDEAHAYLKGQPDAEKNLDSAWRSWQEDDVQVFVTSPEPGARPITYIETGA